MVVLANESVVEKVEKLKTSTLLFTQSFIDFFKVPLEEESESGDGNATFYRSSIFIERRENMVRLTRMNGCTLNVHLRSGGSEKE